MNQKIKHYSIKHNLETILRNSSVNNNNNKEQRNVSDKKHNQNNINNDININSQNIKTSSINKIESVVNNNNTKIKNKNNNNKNLVKELSKKLIIPSALNKIENNNILTKRNRHISLDLNIISSSQNKHSNSSNKVTVNIKGRQNSLRKKVTNGKKNSAAKNNINKNYSIKVQTIQSESNINHKHNNHSSSHIRNNSSSRPKTKYKKQISKDKRSSSKSICNDNNKVSGHNKEIKATSITKLNFALLKQEYTLKPQTNRKSRNIQHDNQLNGCYTERLKKSNVIPSNHYRTTINYKILNKPYNNSFSKFGNVDGVSHGNNNNIKKNYHNNNANRCSESTNKVNFNLGRFKKTKSPP